MAQSLVRALQGAYLWHFRRSAKKFFQAVRQPEQTQAQRLKRLLKSNRYAQYGQAFGFSGIRSVTDYQRKVPLVQYRDLEPWIRRIADGEPRVLTTERVLMMELVGGSSSRHKYIPYTKSLVQEVAAATQPWVHDLHTALPKLRGRSTFWSFSPVGRQAELTPGGLRIGFEHDASYLGLPNRWSLQHLKVHGARRSEHVDSETWRRDTVRSLLAAEDLALISVWSPTFLTVLIRYAETHLDQLLREIPARRAEAIARTVDQHGRLVGSAVWPHLQVISCWTGATASKFIPELRTYFPGTPIQSKGLFTAEGVVSMPVWGSEGAVLALRSHFLEFIDLEHPDRRPLLAHELERGGHYSPVVSTGGGLYRYELGDIVRCVGFHMKTPRVVYEGKRGHISDLVGEKLAVNHVKQGLERAKRETGIQIDFALVTPILGQPPRYRLHLETNDDDSKLRETAHIVERCFSDVPPYAYCRELGQLGPLEVQRIRDGWKQYRDTLVATGERPGEVTPTQLDLRLIWDGAFQPAAPQADVGAA